MKYDENELADAALLLALEEEGDPMPAALAKKILAKGQDIARETRFTTTKAAAVYVEPDVDGRPPRRSHAAAWAGWLAAAACFAFAVYEWRLHATAPQVQASRGAHAIVLRDASGGVVGEARFEEGGRAGLVVDALPESAPGEHYRVWLSADGEGSAAVVGTFACVTACERRALAIDPALAPRGARRVWITRHAVDEPPSPLDRARIVGESGKQP